MFSRSLPAKNVDIVLCNLEAINVSGDWMTVADFGGQCRVEVPGGKEYASGDSISALVTVDVPVRLQTVTLRLVGSSGDEAITRDEIVVYSKDLQKKECLLNAEPAELLLPLDIFKEPSAKPGIRIVLTAEDGREAWNTIWLELTRSPRSSMDSPQSTAREE